MLHSMRRRRWANKRVDCGGDGRRGSPLISVGNHTRLWSLGFPENFVKSWQITIIWVQHAIIRKMKRTACKLLLTILQDVLWVNYALSPTIQQESSRILQHRMIRRINSLVSDRFWVFVDFPSRLNQARGHHAVKRRLRFHLASGFNGLWVSVNLPRTRHWHFNCKVVEMQEGWFYSYLTAFIPSRHPRCWDFLPIRVFGASISASHVSLLVLSWILGKQLSFGPLPGRLPPFRQLAPPWAPKFRP